MDYGNSMHPMAEIQYENRTRNFSLDMEYVEISTSGDENVCPMCAQFEGKIFPRNDAPKLPLCPSCACAYIYYYANDLPSNAVISNKNDFVLPANCTQIIYKNQQKIYEEDDIKKIIQLCENQIRKLKEFMEPYISADFPAPNELACRDLLPKLYMQIGKWKKAENVIKKCIEANAYYPENGSKELADLKIYYKVASETLSYISQNPGCLQRNIYRKMGYEGEEKEFLKEFLRYSRLIRKEKYKNTNQLFCNTEEP